MLRRALRPLAAAAALAAVAPATAAAQPHDIALRDCLITLHGHNRPISALQPRYVPSALRVAPYLPGQGTVAVWQFGCAGISVDGAAERRAAFSLAAVRVLPPDGRPAPPVPTLELANTWDHYVAFAYSDDQAVAAALRSAGVPAEHVPGIRFARTTHPASLPPLLRPLRLTAVTVDAAQGAWSTAVQAKIPQHPLTHAHDNHFWMARAGGGLAQLRLLIPSATDDFCYGTPLGDCGVVRSPAGSRLATFFGGTRVAALGAVDHDPVARGTLLVRP